MPVIQKAEEAVKNIKNGTVLMVGGFVASGTPLKLVESLAETNTKDLTLISVVGGYPGGGFDIGKLSENKQIKKFIGAHIGTDPEMIKQYNSGDIEVEFNPMGTWIERIRAGGAGLGGILTPTGLGTEVEYGREKIIVEGKEFILYPPLKAEVACIKAFKADKLGNLQYRGDSMNSNTAIATAADLVIAEVDEIVEVGEIHYSDVGTPGIFVDIIVQGYTTDERKRIFEDLWIRSNKL